MILNLSTDRSHGNSGKQQHANAHGLTVDGAITLTTTVLLFVSIVSSKQLTSDKQIKDNIRRQQIKYSVSTFNSKVVSYQQISYHFMKCEIFASKYPLSVTFERAWTCGYIQKVYSTWICNNTVFEVFYVFQHLSWTAAGSCKLGFWW